MRYFLDTEFLDDGKTIDLISIGIMAEDGRELYACNLDARLDLASRVGWMKENVLAKLPVFSDKAWMPRMAIARSVVDFMLATKGLDDLSRFASLRAPIWLKETIDGKKPEIWGYYSSYDWVVFCQLFGPMVDLPPQFPKFCRDLKQWSDDLGAPKFPKPEGAHNALVDARWNRDLHKFLTHYAKTLKGG
jgi:hypothetical protein